LCTHVTLLSPMALVTLTAFSTMRRQPLSLTTRSRTTEPSSSRSLPVYMPSVFSLTITAFRSVTLSSGRRGKQGRTLAYRSKRLRSSSSGEL